MKKSKTSYTFPLLCFYYILDGPLWKNWNDQPNGLTNPGKKDLDSKLYFMCTKYETEYWNSLIRKLWSTLFICSSLSYFKGYYIKKQPPSRYLAILVKGT